MGLKTGVTWFGESTPLRPARRRTNGLILMKFALCVSFRILYYTLFIYLHFEFTSLETDKISFYQTIHNIILPIKKKVILLSIFIIAYCLISSSSYFPKNRRAYIIIYRMRIDHTSLIKNKLIKPLKLSLIISTNDSLNNSKM